MSRSRVIRVALAAYRDDPRMGGSLRVAETLARHLPGKGVECRLVFAYGGAGPVTGRSAAPVHFLGAGSARDAGAWVRARRWFREARFDILHFVDPVQWLYLATLGLPVRRLEHFHGRPILPAYSAVSRLAASLHRWASDGGIAITAGARRGVHRSGLMAAGRIFVVYNGVDVDYFAAPLDKARAREELNLPREAKLFGQVARIVPGNGSLENLQLLAHLPADWHAVLVGDGPLRAEIERQAAARGMMGRVHFTGALADVRPAYAALDAVVLLSRYQPFCLMLAEAMAAGTPVFGLRGAGEYAEPENPLITEANSVFVPRAHPEDFDSIEPQASYAALAGAMQRTLACEEAREAMTRRARAWVAERFSAEKQARDCMEVYRRVLAAAPSLPEQE
jgi:glycosyltransferase involved in cell wall biosynthesis